MKQIKEQATSDNEILTTFDFMEGLIKYWEKYLKGNTLHPLPIFELTLGTTTLYIKSSDTVVCPFKNMGLLSIKFENRIDRAFTYYETIGELITKIKCVGDGENESDFSSFTSFNKDKEVIKQRKDFIKNIYDMLEKYRDLFKQNFHPENNNTYLFSLINVAKDELYLHLYETFGHSISDEKSAQLLNALKDIKINRKNLDSTYKEIVDAIYEVDEGFEDFMEEVWKRAISNLLEEIKKKLVS